MWMAFPSWMAESQHKAQSGLNPPILVVLGKGSSCFSPMLKAKARGREWARQELCSVVGTGQTGTVLQPPS